MVEPQAAQVQVNQWKRPLLGNCFDNRDLCLFTFLAPCVTFGYNKQRLDVLQDKDCWIYGCLYTIPVLNWYLGTTSRSDIRSARGIDGDVVNDCLTHACCPCCALMQENDELELIDRNRPQGEPPGAYVVTSQPGPPPDSLPPPTEETPYDPADDDLGNPQEQNKY